MYCKPVYQRYTIVAITILALTWLISSRSTTYKRGSLRDLQWKEEHLPLLWRHVHMSHTRGGAWYIPATWFNHLEPLEYMNAIAELSNITAAARLASYLVTTLPDGHLAHSNIPRIIHQTSKSTNIGQVPDKTAIAIENWLQYATNSQTEMAYFMWDDAGAAELMKSMQPDIYPYYQLAPSPVTKSDVFRVAVCNTIGGIYADIDTIPLRDPVHWIEAHDISPWTDSETNVTYGRSSQRTKLILGIEADTDEHSNDYWRMGYSYPVQLTQWALASAPGHDILTRFLQHFKAQVQSAIIQTQPKNSLPHLNELKRDPNQQARVQEVLESLYPVEFTGPAAITNATMTYLSENASLRWQSLSGRGDGGRSKLVFDTLILPITGFSPGRGKHGNMGSKVATDPDARLRHLGQGSWRKFDFKVETGKLCRTFLGQCRYWSKVPGG